MKLSALSIGKTGELIASAALELLGFHATAVANRKYDLLVDCGSRFIRVQVKASIQKEASVYHARTFAFKTAHGAGTKKKYSESQVDVFALVAIMHRRCVFIPTCDIAGVTTRINEARYLDHKEEARTWFDALEVIADDSRSNP